jgi:hypothetical protein
MQTNMTDFVVGGLYFWIQYADRKRLFLVPESVVFLGKNLEPTETEDLWYFQDAQSYCFYGPETFSEPFDEVTNEELGKIIASETLRTKLVTLPRDNLYQVADCEGLAKAASECAMRRAKLAKPE